jgi:putative ABC transport system permease protein
MSVAVANETFARRFLDGGDPIGLRLRRSTDHPWITIVGIVADVHREGKAAPVEPQLYLPAGQTSLYPVMLADFAVRSDTDPHSLVNAVQREVWTLDDEQPVTNVKTLDEVLSQAVAERRFRTTLLIGFALLALALSLVGVYGVVSYAVSHRRAEFSVRMALGARPTAIAVMVLRQVGLLVAAGVVAGAATAVVAARLMGSLLFGVEPGDPGTFVAVAALLGGAGLIAGWVPARRAALVDPVTALRSE